MRHQTKKIKFKDGSDSNRMIMKKLMYNFLRNSQITTTVAKAKAMKMYLDRAVSKAKQKTEANKNYLLKFFPDRKIITVLFEQIGPAVAKINGGFTKIIRLNNRQTDGALMVRLEWAHPLVIDWGEKKPELAAKPVKKDSKAEGKKSAKISQEK